VQLFTDYLTRLMRYVEFVKRAVPMHDDLFDFFYQACPATKRWASAASSSAAGVVPGPRVLQLQLQGHDAVGAEDVRHPGVVVDGKLVTPTWSRSTSASASCSPLVLRGLGRKEMFVTKDPLGNPVDTRHPWNQHTIPCRRSGTSAATTPG